MHTKLQNTAYYLQVVFLALVIGIGLQIASAWTPPNSAPPTQTVTAPITASSVTQTKFGAFAATGILSGGMLRTTTTGITEGTACPSIGLIATDENGMLFTCQSLTWTKVGGSSTATGGSGAALSSATYKALLGGKTGAGTMSCAGPAPSAVGMGMTSIYIGKPGGPHAATMTVAADASTITISAGGGASNCSAAYACNSYGCLTPNGTYTLLSFSAGGVTYRKTQSLGLAVNSDITLDLNGWKGSMRAAFEGGTASFNGSYTN